MVCSLFVVFVVGPIMIRNRFNFYVYDAICFSFGIDGSFIKMQRPTRDNFENVRK